MQSTTNGGKALDRAFSFLLWGNQEEERKSVHFCSINAKGMLIFIVAWASYQRSEDETPYWRTLKANGELNAKYPNGIEAQKEKLEAEGHTIIQKGRKNIRYYVKDYENSLFDLK